MAYDLILIKYGELYTKGDNKKFFINTLFNNISKNLKDIENIKIEKTHDRIYVYINEKNQNEVISRLKMIPGIFAFSPAKKVDTDLYDIKKEALLLLSQKVYKTFKVETKRSWKKFEKKSTEISREIGGHILKNIKNIKVDVHSPDITLFIEIREKYSYIYLESIPGLGGYPYGVGGKALLMLSGGIDSPVAGFLMMKRGIIVEAIHFESPPHTSERALEKVIRLSKSLVNFAEEIKLHIVPFTKLQEALYKNVKNEYLMIIMRRMMYRISEEIAKKNDCLILVNGESIGQVASQTLESINVINSAVKIPVVRPLATMDKLEIINLAKKIGTYEISIEPYEDCCTIFVPPHPVTRPKLEKASALESKFSWEELLLECVNNTKTIIIKKENKGQFKVLL